MISLNSYDKIYLQAWLYFKIRMLKNQYHFHSKNKVINSKRKFKVN